LREREPSDDQTLIEQIALIFVVSVLLFSAAQPAASPSLTFGSLKARKIYSEFTPHARDTRVVRCEKQARKCGKNY